MTGRLVVAFRRRGPHGNLKPQLPLPWTPFIPANFRKLLLQPLQSPQHLQKHPHEDYFHWDGPSQRAYI